MSSIKNLYLLYSNYSKLCHHLIKITSKLHPYFNLICIDNDKVRKIIIKSKKIKIVPCMFVLFNDGLVQVYEGMDKCLELVKQIEVSVFPQSSSSLEQSSLPKQEEHDRYSKKTPIAQVIQEPQTSTQPPLRVEQESEDDDEDDNSNADNEENIIKERPILREKINRNRGGLDNVVFRPKKCEGHEGMLSSRPELVSKGKRIRNSSTKKNSKENFKELEDLSEALKEDDESQKRILKNSKKSLEETKQKIIEMSKERENLIEHEEEKS